VFAIYPSAYNFNGGKFISGPTYTIEGK